MQLLHIVAFRRSRVSMLQELLTHSSLCFEFVELTLLTVRAYQTGSHRNRGWETFTDAVIKKLSDERENLVFMLWGSYAKAKASLIDATKHCILTTVHPSPRSADYGFFGCKHFSKANEYLRSKGLKEIDW